MKTLIFAFFLSLSSVAFSESDPFRYTCHLVKDGVPRFGATLMKVVFPADTTSRGSIEFLDTRSQPPKILGDFPGVYAHVANVHKGAKAGFMKYTPSVNIPQPAFFHRHFPEVLIKRSRDFESLELTLVGTRKADYICKKF